MAEGGSPESNTVSETVTETVQEETPQASTSPTLRLRLQPPKNEKKVKWDSDTVDNEHMNKKKSKCCCIYEKPKLFGESSSSEDDDDDCTFSCRGHKKKCFRHPDHDQHEGGGHDHHEGGGHDHHEHSEGDPGPSGGGGMPTPV